MCRRLDPNEAAAFADTEAVSGFILSSVLGSSQTAMASAGGRLGHLGQRRRRPERERVRGDSRQTRERVETGQWILQLDLLQREATSLADSDFR